MNTTTDHLSRKFKVFDPDTRKPSVAPPPHACDSQIHIFAPADKYPVRLGAVYHTPKATLAAALRMHRILGIERGVIVQSSAYGTDYRILVDSLAEAGSNYIGCTVMDDSVTDRDLLVMHEGGVRGVRFNFWKTLNLVPDPATFRRSVERVRQFGWFIKLHATWQDLLDIGDLIDPLTEQCMIDHLGYPDFAQPVDQPGVRRIKELLDRGNWWVMLTNGDRQSLSGPPWDDAAAFARSYAAAAPDRVVWGTDWPHPLVTHDIQMKNDADLLEFFYRMFPDKERQKAILVDNPARLFGFPTAAAT